MTPAKKPNLEQPLVLDLTPTEIFTTCLYGAHVTDADFSSIIPGAPDELVVAENKRSGNAARFARAGVAEFGQYVVELQIGAVFVSGLWQWSEAQADPMETDYFRQQAENAFIMAAQLIGKRVERGLVVR